MTTRRDPPISAFCTPRRLCVSRSDLPAFLLHICHEREESDARRTCLDRGLPGAESPQPAIQQLHHAGSWRAFTLSTAPAAPKTTAGLRVSGCKVLLRACQAGRDIVCLDTGTAGVTRKTTIEGGSRGATRPRGVSGRARATRTTTVERTRPRGVSGPAAVAGTPVVSRPGARTIGRGDARRARPRGGGGPDGHGGSPTGSSTGRCRARRIPRGGSTRSDRLGEERWRRVGVGPRYSTTRGVGFRGRRVEPAGPIRSGGLFRVSRSGRHAILFHGWPGRPPVPGGIMETSAASRLGAIWKPWSSSFWPP